MEEKKASKQGEQLPRLLDERLLTALEHEIRAYALSVFTERPASTTEIAAELELGVSAVWYHINKLLELGCIERVFIKEVRGAREHFYRATVQHLFDDQAWLALPEEKRLPIAMKVVRLISGDLAKAVETRGIADTRRHLSRTIVVLDEKGLEEASQLLNETLAGFSRIKESCAKRGRGGPTYRVSMVLMQLLLQGDKPK